MTQSFKGEIELNFTGTDDISSGYVSVPPGHLKPVNVSHPGQRVIDQDGSVTGKK